MFDLSYGRAGAASDVNFTVVKHACCVSGRKYEVWSQRLGPWAYLFPKLGKCLDLSKENLIFGLFLQQLEHHLSHRAMVE